MNSALALLVAGIALSEAVHGKAANVTGQALIFASVQAFLKSTSVTSTVISST